MKHYLKIKPEYLERIASGQKTFEVRFNDRDFQVSDTIEFMEHCQYEKAAFLDEAACSTKTIWTAKINYVLHYPEALKEGWVILGLKSIKSFEVEK